MGYHNPTLNPIRKLECCNGYYSRTYGYTYYHSKCRILWDNKSVGSVIVPDSINKKFTITPDSGYVVADVQVDAGTPHAVDLGAVGSYTFPQVTSDHTISATFEPTPTEWNWATEGWGDWQHNWSVSGTQVGPNSEYGPVMVNNAEGNHGEQGSNTNLLAGSTQSSVWKTFTDPSGVGWNTITFNGLMTASDVPNGRWMTIYVNGNQVFGGTASQSPPGNGLPFTITESFTQSPSVTVTISNGQNPGWGLSSQCIITQSHSARRTTTALAMNAHSAPFVIPDGTGLATNVTSPTTSPTL